MVIVGFGQKSLADCEADILLKKPDHIYFDHLDGTVTDLETGLMWQKCGFGQTWGAGSSPADGSDDTCSGSFTLLTWYGALKEASNSTLYGYADWRLPNKKELISLTDSACSPAFNQRVFPMEPLYVNDSLPFWSSTLHNVFFDRAYTVRLKQGGDFGLKKNRELNSENPYHYDAYGLFVRDSHL